MCWWVHRDPEQTGQLARYLGTTIWTPRDSKYTTNINTEMNYWQLSRPILPNVPSRCCAWWKSWSIKARKWRVRLLWCKGWCFTRTPTYGVWVPDGCIPRGARLQLAVRGCWMDCGIIIGLRKTKKFLREFTRSWKARLSFSWILVLTSWMENGW